MNLVRLKLIGCKVLTREVGWLSGHCPNYLDITWIRREYHDEPDKLRAILQSEIDKIDAGTDPYTCGEHVGEFDAILLGYGLCSNGIAGLTSKRFPLVAPRAHDCISLFLGSKERYRELFDFHNGKVYWYTPGWIENSTMPSKTRYDTQYEIYKEHYDEDNAAYLMEMENGWLKEYKTAAYVAFEGFDFPEYKTFTQEAARYCDWQFNEYPGDMTLLRDFLWGNWDEERFCKAMPGQSFQPSFDNKIITSQPVCENEKEKSIRRE